MGRFIKEVTSKRETEDIGSRILQKHRINRKYILRNLF